MCPPKKRNKINAGLPRRWRFYHGQYRYRVPPGQEHQWNGMKEFPLGKSLPEAYKTWADRMESLEDINTVAQVFERYLLEVVPTKAPKTQTENARQITRLTAVFGKMRPADIKPQYIYQYVDKRDAKVAAHREIEVLSHAMTKAVEWGVIDQHPFKGQVRLEGTKPRDRYVEDWEIIETLNLPERRKVGSVRVLKAYIKIKLMTTMARSDLLRLQPARHFKEDGIHVQRHKTAKTTGKRTVYTWTDELRAAVDEALAARPVDISPFLFCTRQGKGYYNEEKGTANGFDSIWQRFMDRVLAETAVEERFTEHDLRAKGGSDAESLAHARALLAHTDDRTTDRIYRRKPEVVKPLKGV